MKIERKKERVIKKRGWRKESETKAENKVRKF
jgi:hypothetical protein